MAKRAMKKVVVAVICYSLMGLVEWTVDGNTDYTEVGKSGTSFQQSEQVTYYVSINSLMCADSFVLSPVLWSVCVTCET